MKMNSRKKFELTLVMFHCVALGFMFGMYLAQRIYCG